METCRKILFNVGFLGCSCDTKVQKLCYVLLTTPFCSRHLRGVTFRVYSQKGFLNKFKWGYLFNVVSHCLSFKVFAEASDWQIHLCQHLIPNSASECCQFGKWEQMLFLNLGSAYKTTFRLLQRKPFWKSLKTLLAWTKHVLQRI